MKIYKGQYGFSTSANSKTTDGKAIKHYISVQFKKGTEPSGELEGNLIFKDSNGVERPCFLSSYEKKDGSVATKIIIMGGEQEKSVQTNMWGGQTPRYNGQPLDEDLPF